MLAGALLARAPAAGAQVPAPNEAGVAMGHLHYVVRDVEANRRFWMALGGHPIAPVGGAAALRFPDVIVLLERGEPGGGTEGSVLDHVAFRVPTLAGVEAAGLAVARLERFPGVGSVTSPEGERVELFEDAALNLTFTPDSGPAGAVVSRHNRPLAVPVAFHHVHLYVPGAAVAEARAWYARMFGGVPGKRSQYDAVDLPGVNLNFSAAPRPVAPTAGRMLDHVGFEVAGLEAFCRSLASKGARFALPYTREGGGPARALIVDPWGTSIELTEGLRGL
jgi:catechol 2,3-dioxygenase-like lactoylglutathione lyase family enzyme